MGDGTGERALCELFCAPRTTKILTETDGAPKSVQELSAVCDASDPTLYRQVNDLLDRGLLREETQTDEGGNHYTVYRNNVKRADIRIDPETDDVTVDLTFKDTSDQFKRIWEDMRHDP
jgi:predicted transcriptional regulator